MKPPEASTGPAMSSHTSRVAADVTVVIPTLGRDILQRCLESIRQGSCLPGRIVVVDQGNNDAIDEWLMYLSREGVVTRHIPMQGTGRAAALNLGLQALRTPFVLITDDDCEVDHNWLRVMAESLHRHPDRAVTGAVLSGGDEPILNTVRDTRPSVARRPRLTYDRLSGGNCGLPLEALRRVGLFDEDPCTRFAEDGEWAYRALRMGVNIAYEPTAMVIHLGWRGSRERMDQYRGYARTHAAFFGKYLRQGDLFIAARATIHMGRSMLRWLRGSLRGDRELAANGRAYVTQFIPGLLDGMRSHIRPPGLR
jgi:GT2 family glycosyltransferase